MFLPWPNVLCLTCKALLAAEMSCVFSTRSYTVGNILWHESRLVTLSVPYEWRFARYCRTDPWPFRAGRRRRDPLVLRATPRPHLTFADIRRRRLPHTNREMRHRRAGFRAADHDKGIADPDLRRTIGPEFTLSF